MILIKYAIMFCEEIAVEVCLMWWRELEKLKIQIVWCN
jgi:hypothetical protein